MRSLEFLYYALHQLGLELREENGCLILERQITRRWWRFSFHSDKRELIGRIAPIETDHRGHVYEINMDQCVPDQKIIMSFGKVLQRYQIHMITH